MCHKRLISDAGGESEDLTDKHRELQALLLALGRKIHNCPSNNFTFKFNVLLSPNQRIAKQSFTVMFSNFSMFLSFCNSFPLALSVNCCWSYPELRRKVLYHSGVS